MEFRRNIFTLWSLAAGFLLAATLAGCSHTTTTTTTSSGGSAATTDSDSNKPDVVTYVFTPQKAKYNDTVSRSLTADQGDKIDIKNDFGQIYVEQGVGHSVDVEAATFADQQSNLSLLKIFANKDANGVHIHIEGPDDTNTTAGADMKVSVPAGSVVTTEADSDNMTVSGIENDISLISQDGDIRLTKNTGHVTVRTKSGDVDSLHNGAVDINTDSGTVHLIGSKGAINLTSGSGDVTIEQSTSPVTIQTATGDVDLSGLQSSAAVTTGTSEIDAATCLGALTLTSTSGDITVTESKATLPTIELTTQGGTAQLNVPTNASGQIDISTAGGDIDSDFDDLDVNKSAQTGAQTVHGKIGSGSGGPVSIKTKTGDVELKKGTGN